MRRNLVTIDNTLCATSLRARLHGPLGTIAKSSRARALSNSPRTPLARSLALHEDGSHRNAQSQSTSDDRADGAMTQRLQSLSDSDLSGTRAEDIEAAGFSPDLKDQLLQRINDANSTRRLNEQAFSVSELPSSAGRQARDIAAAPAWKGTESVADASLRMLNDSHKPLRVPRGSTPARVPRRIDTGRPAQKPGALQGARLANARDKTSTYSFLKDPNLSDEEREKFREQLKQRFGSTARTVPATVQGLTKLANERIEDAIARGQFKNISMRGKKMEADPNSSSAFVDTTSYLLNKMIKRQDIVPPWVEKQQEMIAAATRFRARLRSDWRRHAARTISAAGGTLESQMARAQDFAAAEMAINPPRRKQETINTVSDDGHLSQISLSGELRIPATGEPPQNETTVHVQPAAELERQIEELASKDAAATDPEPNEDLPAPEAPAPPPESAQPVAEAASAPQPPRPVGPPFRDPTWLATESAYHAAAIKDLNNIARSYNLMAPELAKRPYFNLERELKACYADVAPLLAGEIQERALGPRAHPDVVRGRKGSGLLDNLTETQGHVGTVRDENAEKQYGFKQFWKDVFGSKG